jgi:GTP-binding protein
MEIKEVAFISSHSSIKKCPTPDRPEFAFIGRSNVGKSSLINALVNRKALAKTSVKPGKTQTINHYSVNNKWYLVDLPGYGFASVSKTLKEGFGKMIEEYVLQRETLNCLFILLDSRLEPQKIDLSFIQFAGEKGIPLCLVFTKTDKLKQGQFQKTRALYERTLKEHWDELPPIIVTSAITKKGREDVLQFIEDTLKAGSENV